MPNRRNNSLFFLSPNSITSNRPAKNATQAEQITMLLNSLNKQKNLK